MRLQLATAYVRKIRTSVGRLRQFPFSGQVVPEFGREDLREILQGNYRLIYRISEGRVDMLAVFHGARLLVGAANRNGLYRPVAGSAEKVPILAGLFVLLAEREKSTIQPETGPRQGPSPQHRNPPRPAHG